MPTHFDTHPDAKLPAIESAALTMMFPHPVLRELAKRDIPVRLTLQGYAIGGFYKSGEMLLVPVMCHPMDDTIDLFNAIDRYGHVETVQEFDDLVHLHYSWWRQTAERMNGYADPEAAWVADYKRLGLVREEVITRYVATGGA